MTSHYRPPRRYGLSLGQIEDLADTLDTLNRLCDQPPAKDRIAHAHDVLAKALGRDADLLYTTPEAQS